MNWFQQKSYWLLTLFVALLIGATTSEVSAQDGESNFAQQLEVLARKCEELGLKEQALITRQWMIPDRPDQGVFYPFQNIDHYRPPVNAPELQKFWYDRFTEIRKAEAERLYQQALLLTADLPEAYRILHQALHEDHRHLKARRVLGYSDSTVLQLRPRPMRAKTPMLLTGWQAGEYYTIKTAHFEISTNASPADGAQLARDLEKLYSVWQQAFVEFWCDMSALRKRFNGENIELYNKRIHRVTLFSKEAEYQQFFQQRNIPNRNSTGFYHEASERSFLHLGKTTMNPWVHEVTHQLFSELGPALRNIASEQNIWAIEGVATYMESLQDFGRFATLGGFESKRLQYARYNALVNQMHEPFEQLATFSNDELIAHPRIVQLYSQCSGLTHFLIHGKDGQYRQAFFDLLRKVYTKTDTPGSLAQLARITFGQLDKEYQEFLVINDEDLGRLRPNTKLEAFSAAFGNVTDKGLAKLKGQQDLTWLDASGCAITDESIALFQSLPALKEVTLDGTQISDKSVEVLSELANLDTLDLANTKVTDKAVQMLAGNSTLTVLYLTRTSITDRAAADLETIVNLVILDLTGTKMNPEVINKVKSNLTKLQP